MVSDTRSARKIKDEAEDQNSKKNINSRKDSSSMGSPGKTDISSVRKSARETSLSKQTTPSPQITRKSKRLEQGMSPPVTRKSERLEKHNTPSPVRTTDRSKKNLSSSSFGPKQASKEASPSESKRKKEKTVTQVTMESEKTELELEEVGTKRKKMNARTFRGLFKRQRIKEIATEGDVELEGPDKLSQVCCDNSRGTVYEAMGNGEDVSEYSRRTMQKLSNESIDKASDGALPKSTCSLKGCHEDIENDINENIDATELESSASSARSRDSSVSPEKNTCSPSTECENYNLLGTCALCSKNKRVAHGSPEQELCSCSPTVDEDLGSFSCCKDRSDHGDAVTSESAEQWECRHLPTELRADSQMNGLENECDLCNKDGEILFCLGKDCKRCYHPNCLDPPLLHALPGVWHCPQCVKKKLLFGVHSVSKGVESIWDVREVEVSNAKGVGQRQYLVKYHGLAHVHNHWVAEKQLLFENPSLVSHFIEKDQTVRWNKEWTVPHRLLRKRSIQDKIYIASSAVISVCNNEWLVKWCGLSYDHATWELENAHFLSSSLGQNLMKDYETRQQKAKQEVYKGESVSLLLRNMKLRGKTHPNCSTFSEKLNRLLVPQKESIVELSELPTSRSDVNDNYMLQNVNKLRERLSKCKNAVIFDDLEQAMTVILSIGSMSEICWPFLIVTPSNSLSQWEAEFAQLMPSVDVVVYSGKRETRKGIISSEFYDEEGDVMLQVLLSSTEVFFEDIDILSGIRWEAVVIDEYQRAGVSNDLEQIKLLSTDSRILLVNGQIKDSTSEYLKILSLLESHGDYDKLRVLTSETNDNLCKLKDRLSRFIAYGSISQPSKFLEYWVPVQLSNYQLEQYCDTLLSNSIALRSCSAKDLVGALPDVLLTVRKCCDHPYLVDSSLQERLVAEKRTAAELLEIGIEASGKLQLLDLMLKDIRTRGLQVLILFQQLSTGPGGASTGDILDDFLRQRFGPNSYERVDAGVIPSKKQAAVNRFNKKETGQFAFLLENRACSSVIKLSLLDVIVIYDSDWNPANDLRALQKISVDSKVEQIKVFRLYSSFTVEEKALVLAKRTLSLSNCQNFSRNISHTLLSWGAIYLFSKLDEYHATESDSTLALNSSSGQFLLNEVTKDFQAILSGNSDNISSYVISKVKLGTGSYRTSMPMFGEAKVQVKDGEEPHVFWRNLLEGKHPHWRNLKGPSPRTRKRTHHFDGSVVNAETDKDDVVKKRRKVVNESSDPALVRVELGAHQIPQIAVSEGGPSTIKAHNQSEKLQRDIVTSNNNPSYLSAQSSFVAEDSASAPKERIVSSNEQERHCSFLQGEMTRLCQILKLSDDVTLMVGNFLEYVTKNHHVNSDSPSILQAFQISLCWIAASITKQKVDKKDSLMLAKQLLNYQCTEEQVNSVYLKMRLLKRMFLLCSEKTIDLGKNCSLAEENTSKEPSNHNEGGSQFSPSNPRFTKMEIGGESANEEHAEGQTLLQQKKDKASVSEIDHKIKKIQKKCDKRMKKLICKHQEEIKEFHHAWEEKSSKLETDHKLETALIRSIHGEGSVGKDKLKLLDDNFAKKMEEHNLLKDQELNDLEKQQLAEINEERQKAANWLTEVKSYSSKLGAVNAPESLGSQPENGVLGPQPSTVIYTNGPEVVGPMSGELLEGRNPSNSFCVQGNDIAPSIAFLSTPAEAIRLEAPVKNLATANSQNQLERSSEAMAENLNQLNHPNDNAEAVSAHLPASAEQGPGESQPVDQSEEVPVEAPRTLSNENVEHVQPEELSNASNEESDRGSKTASPDALVVQKDGPDEAASGGLQSPGQQLARSQQTEALPVASGLLTQQVQQDRADQSLISAEPQDLDAPAVEKQNQTTSQIEVAAAGALDTVSPMPSNPEEPGTDEIVTSLLSNHEALVTDVSLSCNLSRESISQHEENIEIHNGDHGVGPTDSVVHGQSVEAPAISQSDVLHTAEQPNQGLPLGIGAEHLNAQSYLFVHPNQHPASWSSNPSLLADPLQSELERLRKETALLKKGHEDMVSQLKSDCEKEIQEMITQIRLKYELKRQQSEDEFRLRRNELEKSHNKVLMNKILAEAFRSKCLDLRPSGLPSVQQVVPSSFMQHLHQVSQSAPTRPPTGPPPNQQHMTTPTAPTMPQLYRPNSLRSSPIPTQTVAAAPPVQSEQHTTAALRSSPVPAQGIAPPPPMQAVQQTAALRSSPVPAQTVAPSPPMQGVQQPAALRSSPVIAQIVAPPLPVQAVQHTAALFSGSPSPAPSRPPLISAITPAAVNPRPSGEIRARAPHLQPFRPAASTSPPVSQLRPQQIPPSQPVQPPLQAVGPLGLHNSALSMNRPDRPNSSLSTLGMLVDMDHRPNVAENGTSSPLPDICSTFHTLELSDFEILGDLQGNQTSAVERAVVCLSDDD